MSETKTAKTPTIQGINALLRKAGFQKAVISITGGNSGYQVTKCRARADCVKVRQYFYLGGVPDQRYREQLRRYAKTIEAAGYTTEIGTYHLVVAAKDSTGEEQQQ